MPSDLAYRKLNTFLRSGGIESLLRDVQASHFHPLQEKRQLLFTGSLAMGQQPPAQAF